MTSTQSGKSALVIFMRCLQPPRQFKFTVGNSSVKEINSNILRLLRRRFLGVLNVFEQLENDLIGNQIDSPGISSRVIS